MPYPNEHSCRLRDPKDMKIVGSSVRKSDGKEYRIIMGIPEGEKKSVEQAYRYPIEEWAEGQAKEHCKEHKGTFEPAEPVKKENKKESKMENFTGKIFYRSDFIALDKDGKASRYKKELIKTGKFLHPQIPNLTVEITVAKMEQWVENFAKYKKSGGSVPVPLRHSSEPDRNTGWVEELKVEGKKLFGVLHITEPDIAEKIDNGTIKDVSISIMSDFVDEHGMIYETFIDHIALTSYPQIRSQGPFIKLESGMVEMAKEEEENEMEELEKAKAKITELETEKVAMTDKLAELEAKIVELEKAKTEAETKKGDGKDDKKAEGEANVKTDTTELEAKVTELEKYKLEKEKAELHANVEALVKAGKLPPAMKNNVLALLEAKTDSVEFEQGSEKRTLKTREAMFEVFNAMPCFAGFDEKTVQMSTKEAEEKADVEIGKQVAAQVQGK